MQQDAIKILTEVLTIIGYEGDKEAYVSKFIQSCENQALIDLLQALSQEEQEQFKQQITRVIDQEQQKAIIQSYITPEQYQEALQQASATAFEEFLDEVVPTLSTDQNNNLQTYLNSLTTSTATK